MVRACGRIYSVGFSSRRAAPGASRRMRLARLSARRSIIWLMMPRGFLGAGPVGPLRTGGEIFSNMNAGIVYPLAVELKHSW